MKATYLKVVLLLLIASAFQNISGQILKADYNFQGNLTSSVGSPPNLIDLVGSGQNSFAVDIVDGYTRQTLRFPFNSGVALFNSNTVVPNSAYTMVVLFKFDNLTGYRRVGDFKNGTSQTGAYLLNGRFEAEATTTTALLAGTFFQAVIVRESNGHVRAYRDGVLRVDIANDNGLYQISTDNVLRFAQDDFIFGGEASAGNLARLRLYDAPMTTTQVSALDRVANATGGGNQPILFSSGRDGFTEIYSMNNDGGNQRRLTNNEVTELEPKWSPNGQRIIYSRRETTTSPYQIWIMNADGTGQTRLTNVSTNDHNPKWKPDGSKIMFGRCDPDFVCDLFTMNPDGTNQVAIPNVNTVDDEDDANYSPDGSKIIFSCSTLGSMFANGNICVANVDGTNRQQMTFDISPILNRSPVYSPDGTKIAFYRFLDETVVGSSEIYKMDANGSNQIRLTNNTVSDFGPVWSPDNTKLLFTSARDVITEVYSMNTDGSAVNRLTVNCRSESVSDWRRAATVDGRVVNSVGRGVRNALVSITDAQNVRRTMLTNYLGFYSFANVRTGEAYTMAVLARRYTFTSQFIQVDGNLSGVDFVGSLPGLRDSKIEQPLPQNTVRSSVLMTKP